MFILLLSLESSKLDVFKNIKFLGGIYSNWLSDILRTNVCKTIESCW